MKPIARIKKPAVQRNRSVPRAGSPRTLLYRNSKYGFSIRLPRRWKCYTVIRRSSRRLDDAEYAVYFLFKYKGKIYESALTLLVYRMTLKKWIEEGYDESPIIRMAVRNGRIYAYALPSELPEEFLNARGDDYDYKRYGRPIRILSSMVNDDVPKIVKTFKLR
ncbi:hypothetical protein [Paenibacillus riograndensis]|uniref:Uncharacterized protein n=1 Tax=Paenibacillus riograndensis SBR5 TaxID=1073571 RepID=A0A0E4CUA6_9BACL|nr:hypothetical protein [Paenibacillus riograndensis]CQR51695.1 hypothetical protein PRIO_0442 [Paenibacillus riograndensis SBR5]